MTDPERYYSQPQKQWGQFVKNFRLTPLSDKFYKNCICPNCKQDILYDEKESHVCPTT